MFRGSIPALVTPFRGEAFDEPGFRAFVEWQISEGSHGLAPCGTTGESATLSFEEHDRVIDLTAKEYELLELFLRNPRQVLTREMIYDEVWGYDFGGESNIIEVYIRYLRQKLEEGKKPRLLHTVRGMGYVLREDA